MKWYGGIEAGGTKINCIIAQDPDHIFSEITIPTQSPSETLPKVIQFFKENEKKGGFTLSAMGIASFGPVNLDRSSDEYGNITSTPKLEWKNTPLLRIIQNDFEIPIHFDTDVNGAAIGEGKWGAGVGISDFIYITVGTGVGGGIIVNGIPLHGLIHPELGHMLVRHDFALDPFEGICPYHKDCLEGLVTGPSIAKRWGCLSQNLPSDHVAWELEANYLAQAVHNLCLICSPKRIILGGGVMKTPGLINKVQKLVPDSLNGYIDSEAINKNIDSFIVPPSLGDRAGTLGAIALAQMQ